MGMSLGSFINDSLCIEEAGDSAGDGFSAELVVGLLVDDMSHSGSGVTESSTLQSQAFWYNREPIVDAVRR